MRRSPRLSLITLTGKGVNIFISAHAVLDYVYPKLIEVGDNVTITAQVVILTHDAFGVHQDGKVRAGRVILEDYVGLGVGAIIHPGVRIGKESFVGAGSVVVSGTDIPPGEVWAGVPARRVGTVDEMLAKKGSLRSFPISHKKALKIGEHDIEPLEVITISKPPKLTPKQQKRLRIKARALRRSLGEQDDPLD